MDNQAENTTFDTSEEHKPGECSSVATKCLGVNLPLRLKPFGKLQKYSTECCGEPAVTILGDECNEKVILIKQVICIRIPLTFGAEIDEGKVHLDC